MDAEFENADDEPWDAETMLDIRRFAFEQALLAHLHKRDGGADMAAVFALSDRIVAYVVGELNP